MKQFFTLLLSSAACLGAQAQAPYPAPPPAAPNIVKAEYFFDVDPGFGLGNPITVPASTNIADFTQTLPLSGTALAKGFHLLYIRTMDANGKWSQINSAFFSNYPAPPYETGAPPPSNITEAEYFIDTDPGLGRASKIPIAAGTDLNGVPASLNITGLAPGSHRLYIRTKDANGRWSLTNTALFDNTSVLPYPLAPAAATAIGQLEYFIDTDPGIGRATPVNVTSSSDIQSMTVNLALSGLSTGPHTLYIRSKAELWSHTAYASFSVDGVLPLTWLYVKGTVQQQSAALSWSTAQELNTASFAIEHSTDGSRFATVGEVRAAGNASGNYSFTHPQIAQGFNYYRIRQVDKDGRFSYSKVITLLNRDNLEQTAIGPNPARSSISIIQPKGSSIVRVEVYAASGARVKEQLVDGGAGQVINVNVQQLPAGTYTLRLIGKGKTEARLFIKE